MILALLLFLFVTPSVAHAQLNSVVIVNQVRGSECCEPGSFDHLKLQLETTTRLGQRATYALRYDALSDDSFTTYLQESLESYPDLVQIGAFLEITPTLAKHAGVQYRAIERDWYKTEHAYCPGYGQGDRLLLIDAYMAKYFEVFGEYPKLSVGWFVDTYSLNYLQDKFGVLVHELTREQWGTDSYTLSGGPVHYPYVSSRNWSFLPGDTGITIIRQTLPDPDSNYGDRSSSHTSQPNDYGQNKDFSYFTSLLDNAFSQPDIQSGFAVLGLENSMGHNYQTEYVKQLEYLASNYANIVYPSPLELKEIASTNKLNLYQGQGATWITTPSYQLRIISNDGQVMITDLRIYNQDLLDPYLSRQVQNGGFFVAPYLIDSSRWHQLRSNWFKQIIDPQYNEGYIARNDFLTIPTNLSLPPKKAGSSLDIQKLDETIQLKYISSSNKPITFDFQSPHFSSTGLSPSDLKYHDKSGGKLPVKETKTKEFYRLEWFDHDQVVSSLVAQCSESCDYKMQVNSELFRQAQTTQSFLLLPTTTIDSDTSGSLVYPSLTYLVHGRSPARVVVFPRNSQGNPVTLPYPVEFEDTEMTLISDPVALQSQEAQFYDFEVSHPGEYRVKVLVPGLESQVLSFYFAPDCRNDLTVCLKNPPQLYYYLRAIIAGKLQK